MNLPPALEGAQGAVSSRAHVPVAPLARALALTAAVAALLVARAAHGDQAPTFADRDVRSDEGRDRSFALLVSPLAMTYGMFGAETDFVVSPAFVVALDVAAVRTPSWAPTRGANGASVGAAVMAYPCGGAFHAFYVGARLGVVRSWHEPIFHVDGRDDVAEFGIAAGWQWTWDYGFSVRLGGGPLVAVGAPPTSMAPELLAGPLRFALSADVSVGWAF